MLKANIKLVDRLFYRHDEFLKAHGMKVVTCKGNRELLLSNEFVDIAATDLDGKCQVQHILHISNLDTYYG